jgi:carbon-monoxide dehydrogenase iron sulfur subunit
VKQLIVDERLCSGCRACQVACVAAHEGVFGVSTARIHVVKVEPLGIDRPEVCRQCEPASCIDACPTGALEWDEATGAVSVDVGSCIACGACVEACPFGMAALHPMEDVAIICDLCGGEPACVRRCATGAIRFAAVGPAEGSQHKAGAVLGQGAPDA